MKNNNIKGITLIALVITIIVLLILAGVTIATLTGDNGLLKKAQTGSEETEKSQATETMNLKITNIQISSYAENHQLPNLQYLADKLCEDNDMEYVLTETKKHASLDKIDVTNISSIYTKLKAYPYEFEINSSLQLASIDGIKIADNDLENNSNSTTTNENYSTEEVKIGTWIDGKPLYRKVIREQITGSGNIEYFLSQKVPDAESYIIESAFAFDDSTYTGVGMVVSSSNNSNTRYDISFTSFNLKTGRVWLIRGADSPSYLQLIVKYTKTTD